jgi:hypothetical protein
MYVSLVSLNFVHPVKGCNKYLSPFFKLAHSHVLTLMCFTMETGSRSSLESELGNDDAFPSGEGGGGGGGFGDDSQEMQWDLPKGDEGGGEGGGSVLGTLWDMLGGGD